MKGFLFLQNNQNLQPFFSKFSHVLQILRFYQAFIELFVSNTTKTSSLLKVIIYNFSIFSCLLISGTFNSENFPSHFCLFTLSKMVFTEFSIRKSFGFTDWFSLKSLFAKHLLTLNQFFYPAIFKIKICKCKSQKKVLNACNVNCLVTNIIAPIKKTSQSRHKCLILNPIYVNQN